MRSGITYFFALMLLLSAITHMVNPSVYAGMIPEFIAPNLANIMATIVEAIVAVLLLLPKYRPMGGLAFAVLMVAFLPIHIGDLFKENPAIGAPPLPSIRLAFQFVLIYGGYWIYKVFK